MQAFVGGIVEHRLTWELQPLLFGLIYRYAFAKFDHRSRLNVIFECTDSGGRPMFQQRATRT